ncbi:MAG: hypothetical protein JRN29_05105 [Nitrososphaerota archaeon]|nr:hypothetical protein [Nitrososphaerota archaeon]
MLSRAPEASGCDPRQCFAALETLLGAASPNAYMAEEYRLNREDAVSALRGLLSTLPSWSEEVAMDTLCSNTGGSVAEVYERIMGHGLGMAATYKIVERLKAKGFVFASRHFRVSDRGPMREYLMTNCRNCFYGYTSEERCLMDAFRKLEDLASEYYGRMLPQAERMALYMSLKSIPFNSRIARRILHLLTLIYQVEGMMKEERVMVMLRKIQEGYGLDSSLPGLG